MEPYIGCLHYEGIFVIFQAAILFLFFLAMTAPEN